MGNGREEVKVSDGREEVKVGDWKTVEDGREEVKVGGGDENERVCMKMPHP